MRQNFSNKIKESEYDYAKSSFSSIYISTSLWRKLTFNEKLSVIFHEVGHKISRYRYLYYPNTNTNIGDSGYNFSYCELLFPRKPDVSLFGISVP